MLPILLALLAPGADDAFPRAGDRVRFVAGLDEAEAFRRRLLAGDAEPLADLVADFPETWRRADGLRPGGFTLARPQVVAALEGKRPGDAAEAFARFGGRWHGRWTDFAVDHHWRPVVRFAEPIRLPRSGARVVLAQYAWVGDGFGWNALARTDDGDVILGSVHHFGGGDPARLHTHVPLVGIADGPTRLVWLTPTQVFFEEVFPEPSAGIDGPRYVITGRDWTTSDGRPQWTGAAFQACYTRDPDDRPEFRRVELP